MFITACGGQLFFHQAFDVGDRELHLPHDLVVHGQPVAGIDVKKNMVPAQRGTDVD